MRAYPMFAFTTYGAALEVGRPWGVVSLPIIGKSLGHTQVKTTAIYARLALDPVRQSVESATSAILEAGKASVGATGIIIGVLPSEEDSSNGKQ